MSWLYLREVGVGSSEASLVDSEPSARSSGTPTAKPFSWPGKLTASWNASRYGTTCEPSKEPNGVEKSTSLPQVFLANLSVLPANEKVKVMTETDGLTPSESYGRWDQDSHCWKTSKACLIGMEDVTSEKYLESFPKAGLMQDGRLFQRLKLEPRIGAIGSGYWPTPRAQVFATPNSRDWKGAPGPGWKGQKSLARDIKNFPTPTSQDHKDNNSPSESERHTPQLTAVVGGQLNPPWVEWLMNWPIGWTLLSPLPKEVYDDWKLRTQGSTEEVRGQAMRSVWWDQDPSETPYRPKSIEQQSVQHKNPLPDVPQRRTSKGGRLGKRIDTESKVRDMPNGVQAQKAQEIDPVRKSEMPENEGQIISRIAMGVNHRVDRLKAIGNGQVPSVAATAFRILSEVLI